MIDAFLFTGRWGEGGGGLLAAVYTIYISGEIFLAPLEK